MYIFGGPSTRMSLLGRRWTAVGPTAWFADVEPTLDRPLGLPTLSRRWTDRLVCRRWADVGPSDKITSDRQLMSPAGRRSDQRRSDGGPTATCYLGSFQGIYTSFTAPFSGKFHCSTLYISNTYISTNIRWVILCSSYAYVQTRIYLITQYRTPLLHISNILIHHLGHMDLALNLWFIYIIMSGLLENMSYPLCVIGLPSFIARPTWLRTLVWTSPSRDNHQILSLLYTFYTE